MDADLLNQFTHIDPFAPFDPFAPIGQMTTQMDMASSTQVPLYLRANAFVHTSADASADTHSTQLNQQDEPSLLQHTAQQLGDAYIASNGSSTLHSHASQAGQAGTQQLQLAQSMVRLPAHIPAQCVTQASMLYSIPAITLLGVLKVESGGKLGVVRKNNNGTHDLGPAQLNTGAWGRYFYQQYGVSANTMAYDMCTSLKLMGYALRTLINRAGGDYWRGVGNYHSATPSKHWRYIYAVHQAQQQIAHNKAF